MKTAFMIAAPTSGSGKTTIARGLMALLRKQGMAVQPFKCGPDYIDTKFHQTVCGRPSINLDTFMASPDHVRELFLRYGADADACIVEGMMGLFDGYDRDLGSSAEIARVLGIPVVLVVDAKSAAYSMAPLLQGFIRFREDVHIAGVIFNKVGSARHQAMLQQVCDDLHVECFGYLPKAPSLEQDSRYLGLDFSKKTEESELLSLLEKSVDSEALTKLGVSCVPSVASGKAESSGESQTLLRLKSDFNPTKVRAVIARNAEAFSFIYQETLDFFGQTTFFDPETEVPSFDGIDLLYLPGGYPEKHLEALAQNEAARRAIREFAERGGRIQAECGGMMYLCRSILTDEGEYPMCGVLPYTISARKADRKLSLGYRRFTLDGREYRGHEFHYTQFVESQPASVTQVYNAKGEPVPTPVFRYKNVLASYTHLAPLLTSPKGRKAWRSPVPVGTPPLGGGREGLHPIMFVGTGSDVGKSVVAAAFCRIFRQDGYHPAPFKAQNMALNSYATPEGLEIGRAQAVQAEAAGIPCHTDMNPLLLKPQSDHTSQVVLHGKPIGNRDAYDYWKPLPTSPKGRSAYGHRTPPGLPPLGGGQEGLDFRKEVCTAFDRLASRYNPIVMEGAGSISELNLKDRDLVNLPMARHAKADVILVGDIDRGGVFASVYGSIALQEPEDRRLIKGIIINKFRGDMRLFDEGRHMLEQICGIPVLGVIPYFKDIHIEEEDSVAIAQKSFALQQGKVNIAVVMLRQISNYTDFSALEQDARVHLFYTSNVDDLLKADIIILPGTKSTLHDLYELRRNGVAQAIVRAHREGASILGICGGYQMMGVEVCDPDHVEGDIERLPGLGLLPITTTMSGEKVTRQVAFSMPSCHDGKGYEIHMGETRPFGDAEPQPLAHLSDGHDDGYIVDGKCMGTYLHGILDNAPFVDFLLQPFAEKLSQANQSFDYQAFKEEQYDRLAAHVRKYVDMERIYEIIKN